MYCIKVFLEFLQNSQENTCARVSFLINLQTWGLFFCDFCEILKNIFSNKPPPVAASDLKTYTVQKMKFSIEDLVTFTEEILNGKLHFLCSVSTEVQPGLYY